MAANKKSRTGWILALLVALALGGLGTHQYLNANGEPPPRTAAVELGDVELTVTALGSLKPKDYVDVGTQVSGQLKKVHVEIGDRVERGALLAEIDPTVYETRVRTGRANLNRLKASVAQQQAELALARQRLERNQRLLAAKAISAQVVEEDQASVKVAQARLNATHADISAAESTLAGDIANLGYTKIYAPMAGTVVSESAVEGQTVNASQSAPVIVRIANLDTMTVWAKVAEADVVKLKSELPVYFTTLGMPEKRWRGVVRQVLPTPEIVNDVVLYHVLVDVPNTDHLLMTDMTVQVFFVLGEAREVPVVPASALSRVPGERGAYQARVLVGESIESRKVKVGVMSRTSAHVVEGLDVGELVVLGGAGGEAGAQQRRRPSMGPRL